MSIKCKLLIIDNFYPDGNRLYVLGKIVYNDSYKFILRTGTGKQYRINHNSQYKLLDTNVDYKNKCPDHTCLRKQDRGQANIYTNQDIQEKRIK